MSSTAASITAIIPCFNHADLLPRAVKSVLAQEGDLDLDVIVVDDGSTDATPEVCRALRQDYPALRVIRKPNGGLSNARNAGLRAARGEFIHFLDSDDYIAGTMYSRMLTELAHTQADLAYCGFEVIDVATGRSFTSTGEALYADMRKRLLLSNLCPVHCFVLRRAVADETGYFDEQLAACEDWDYWLRAALRRFRFAHVPEILAFYERRGSNMSDAYRSLLRNGEAVLNKTRLQGLNAELEAARQDGARLLRRWVLEFSYCGTMHQDLENGKFGRVLRELAGLWRDDPRAGWELLKLLTHHKRAIVRGIGAVGSRKRAGSRKDTTYRA